MIRLQTFGAVELRRGDTDVRSVLSQPKRLAFLVHILLGSPSGYMSRDAVLARFWPDADEERARNSLRQTLHYLRRSLGEGVIENRGDEIGCPPGAIHCDALDFQEALEQGRLEDAVRCYRGDFLPAFFVDEAPEVESWIDARRGWYREQAGRAAGALADREAAAGELKAAALWAREASTIQPHDEAAARRLVVLLARSGETAAGLAAYDEFVARLHREFGIEPSEETRALAAGLREEGRSGTGDPGPVLPSAPPMEPPSAPSAVSDPPLIPATPLQEAPPPPVTPSAASSGAPTADPPAPAGRFLSRFHRPAVGAAALILMAVAAWYTARPAATVNLPAVAVLPFTNLSGDPANQFLSDALAEELLSVLTRVPGLQVAARTSSFSFRGKDVSVDSVARALGVGHVVEGSVRLSGNRLRVAVQLIDAESGLHIWSESYDREAGDLIGVQDEIARAVARSLQVELSPAMARPPASETDDPEAYRLLLRANQVMRSGSTREVFGEAEALLQEALRHDPGYGRALASLASVLSWQSTFRFREPENGFARARELASRALEISPLAEAHLVLARDAEGVQWDTAAADHHYREALAINPRDPRTLQLRAVFLSRSGRVEEGIASARQAVDLDPLHPGAYNNLAVTLLEANRLEEAGEAYQGALRVSPEDPIILGNLANLMARRERWDEALAYLDRALVRTPEDLQSLGLRTSILLRSGRRDEGLALLRELEARPDIPRLRMAILYSNVGDVERILDLLEEAVDAREDGLLALRSPDMFRGMREHPRFVSLLERLES